MSIANQKASIVRVKIEEGKTGLFFATSPDLRGLLVAEPTLDALEEAIPVAISDLFAALGARVLVTKIDDDGDDFHPWVAFPAEVARRALDKVA